MTVADLIAAAEGLDPETPVAVLRTDQVTYRGARKAEVKSIPTRTGEGAMYVPVPTLVID